MLHRKCRRSRRFPNFFSDEHADIPRAIRTHQFVNFFIQSSEVRHSEADICPYRINISYLWTTDHWALFIIYWAHRECRPWFPDTAQGSTSDDIFFWLTSLSSCCPNKPDTVCIKPTSSSRLMVIETVSLPESSAIAESRRTVSTGMSTDSPPTILSPLSALNCLLTESPTIVIFHTSQQTILKI